MRTSSISTHTRAISLRQKGVSLNTIARELKISKSTASIWVRGVPLSVTQRNILEKARKNAGQTAFRKAAQAKHIKHRSLTLIAERKGTKDTSHLSKRDVLMIGLGLYWGEGYKKGSAELGFTNSDPKIIRFFVRWIYESFGIKKDRLILRVTVNQTHTRREKEIISFWGKIVEVPALQFTKTSFVKTKQKRFYTNHAIHYGTLRVKIRKGSVLRSRILSALKTIK